jgi:hypothetical protein
VFPRASIVPRPSPANVTLVRNVCCFRPVNSPRYEPYSSSLIFGTALLRATARNRLSNHVDPLFTRRKDLFTRRTHWYGFSGGYSTRPAVSTGSCSTNAVLLASTFAQLPCTRATVQHAMRCSRGTPCMCAMRCSRKPGHRPHAFVSAVPSSRRVSRARPPGHASRARLHALLQMHVRPHALLQMHA